MGPRIAVLLVVAACGRREATPTPEPVVETSAVVAEAGAPVAIGDAAAVPALALPAQVGPPPPFDRLRPRMKQADVQAVLAETGVRAATVPDGYDFSDATVYEAGVPGVLVAPRYRDGRLHELRFQALDERALLPAIARWGDVPGDDESIWGIERAWPAGPSGWRAALYTEPAAGSVALLWKVSQLVLIAADEAAADTVTVTAAVFPQLAALIGAPLATAERTLGAGLRRETANADEDAAERGAARQGYATLVVPWDTRSWELVLEPVAGSDRIRAAVLTGGTEDEAGRVALFDALRAAFGTPRPIVTEAGRVAIELVSARVRVRVAEDDRGWTIVIAKR